MLLNELSNQPLVCCEPQLVNLNRKLLMLKNAQAVRRFPFWTRHRKKGDFHLCLSTEVNHWSECICGVPWIRWKTKLHLLHMSVCIKVKVITIVCTLLKQQFKNLIDTFNPFVRQFVIVFWPSHFPVNGVFVGFSTGFGKSNVFWRCHMHSDLSKARPMLELFELMSILWVIFPVVYSVFFQWSSCRATCKVKLKSLRLIIYSEDKSYW